MYRIAVCISGRGSLLPPICEAIENGSLPAVIACVISDRPGTAGLERAEAAGIPALCIDRRKYRDPEGPSLSDAILQAVEGQADFIVLAGFLSILQGTILEKFTGKIINIHPALLPKHGGRGMYGMRVHQAVIESGDRMSGSTVHFVTSGIDTGPIITQRSIEVLPEDTPDSLRHKVGGIEGDLLVEALRLVMAPLKEKRGVVK